MIMQAVRLLNGWDKELEHFAIRLREWHGWHFTTEMGNIVFESVTFLKAVKNMGSKSYAKDTGLAVIGVPESSPRRTSAT